MTDNKNKADSDIYQLLRDRISLKEYCENELGFNFHRIGKSYRATVQELGGGHDAFCINVDTPNLWIQYAGANKEHSSKGDIIELCAIMNHDGDKGAALKELAEKFLTESEREQYMARLNKWLEERKAEQEEISRYHENLTSGKYENIKHWFEYLHSRGIDDGQIKRLKLGYSLHGNGGLVIPRFNYDGVEVIGHSTRRMPNAEGIENEKEPKYQKAFNNSFVRNAPLGLQTLSRADKPPVLTEGDFDYMNFENAGYPVVGKIESEKYWPEIIAILEERDDRVYLAYDNDEQGKIYTRQAADRLFKAKIKFSVVNLPENYDVNDYYKNGGKFDELIANATDGLEYFAMNFKPNENDSKATVKKLKEELKKFLIQVKRNGLDDADVQSLYENLIRTGYSPEWLQAVKKQADKGESESKIVDAIMAEHELLCNCRTGFYEYDDTSGIWRPKDDKAISGYVKKRLGNSCSAKKLYSVVEHLKTAVNGNEPVELFNKRPLFAFQNGTLFFRKENINDELFRAACAGDYVTHRVEYEYDEKAECSEWLNALDVIMDSDEKRIKCFQEFCGYCLLPHCKYEKALILRDKNANGSNGKSTLLKVLREVLGAENTSSLEPFEFADKFSLIYLKDAKVNICNDARADISGAETTLKKAISGETLRACYKYKDFIEFNNHAKIIFAINGSIKAENIDGALLRRCLLIDFNMRFVDEPVADNELKKNIHISDKLMAEKAGIFNWIVKGAARLIKQGRFTETDEQAELIGAFTTVTEADTVNEFVAENSQNFSMQRIILADMFLKYVTFCTENEIKPLDNHKFYKVFEARLTTQNISYQRKHKKFLINGELKNKEFYEFY